MSEMEYRNLIRAVLFEDVAAVRRICLATNFTNHNYSNFLNTPLHCAAGGSGSMPDSCEQKIEVLVNVGHFDVNITNDRRSSNTPLIDACACKGSYLAVKKLLELRADPNISNIHGVTALIKAAKENDPEVVDILLRYNADVNPPLLLNNPNFDRRHANAPVLHAASFRDDDDYTIAEILVKHGAQVNIPLRPTLFYLAPLSAAIELENVQIAQFLLEHGANPNVPPTLLHTAVTKRFELVKLLVVHGANISALDSEGRKPIDIVCNDPFHTETFELLQHEERLIDKIVAAAMAWNERLGSESQLKQLEPDTFEYISRLANTHDVKPLPHR